MIPIMTAAKMQSINTEDNMLVMNTLSFHDEHLRHPFRKTADAKNNDQDRHKEQGPDLVYQIKKT